MPNFNEVFQDVTIPMVPLTSFGTAQGINNFLNSKGLPTIGATNATGGNTIKLPGVNTSGAGKATPTGPVADTRSVAGNGVGADPGAKQQAGGLGGYGDGSALFARAAVVVLGFIFVASGLAMFRGGGGIIPNPVRG